jgi:hypothetical protein
MTTDEFERMLAAFRDMRSFRINSETFVPLESVIRVIYSHLHADDRSLYELDFKEWRWIKKSPGPDKSS